MFSTKRIYEIILVSTLLLIQFILLTLSILHESRVYDEATFVKAGFVFLKDHDFRYDPFNPPLAREIVASPVLLDKTIMDDPILFWPRMMVVIFTILLGALSYVFARRLFGHSSAILALVFYVFEPNILAHGHYATTDLIFTFFFVLSLFLFWIWRKDFTRKKIIVFAIILGFTLSTKTTALPFLIPSLVILYMVELKQKKDVLRFPFWKKRLKYLIILVFVAAISLWGTYFFTFEPPLGYRYDPNRPAIKLAEKNIFIKIALNTPIPLGSYISSIKQQFLFNYSGWYRKDSMIFGNVSSSGHLGYYFPLLLLIKLPVPLIFLSVFGFTALLKSKRGYICAVPLIIVLFEVIPTKVALVVRYILPVFPLLIIIASYSWHALVDKELKVVVICLCVAWIILGTVKISPYYITFLNELTGYKINGYKYVFDANLDWGQGLLALKKYQNKDNVKKLQLAYFGDIPPSKLGIEYEHLKDTNPSDTKKTMPLKFNKGYITAISITCWYLCGYYKNEQLKKKIPDEIIAGSILIFKHQ